MPRGGAYAYLEKRKRDYGGGKRKKSWDPDFWKGGTFF